MLFFGFIACCLPPHKEQQQSRSHALQNQPAGYHLLVAPALALAHMVVEGGQGVFQNPNVQKTLQADLQNAQAAVRDEHDSRQQEGERMAALEGQHGDEKAHGAPASPISRLEGLALSHR